MRIRKPLSILLLVGFTLTMGSVTCAAEDPEEAAVAAAKKWLALVDKGEFEKSWQSAASLFKNAVTEQQWSQQLGAVRTPLGALQSREVESATFATSLPGAPDGEYVVIQFKTVFANKSTAVETVTPMKDSDGKWRVSGYFIK